MNEIKSTEELLAERDNIVKNLDVEGMKKKLIELEGMDERILPGDEVLIISLHKSRVELGQLPSNGISEQLVNESKQWLKERGYQETRS